MAIDAGLVTAQSPRMANSTAPIASAQILNEMRPERIGARLSLIRRALGLSSSEIADALGIERTYWSRFENGRRAPNELTVALLMERYGVTSDFVIFGRWAGLPFDLATRMRAIEAE